MNCRRNVQLDQFFSQLRSKLKNVYAVLPGEKLFGLLNEKKQFFVFHNSHRCTEKFASFIVLKKKKLFSDGIPNTLIVEVPSTRIPDKSPVDFITGFQRSSS